MPSTFLEKFPEVTPRALTMVPHCFVLFSTQVSPDVALRLEPHCLELPPKTEDGLRRLPPSLPMMQKTHGRGSDQSGHSLAHGRARPGQTPTGADPAGGCEQHLGSNAHPPPVGRGLKGGGACPDLLVGSRRRCLYVTQGFKFSCHSPVQFCSADTPF